MHDQSCHVPSAACQMPKSTGCCLDVVYFPRSGSPATCQNSPSIRGTRTRSSASVLPASHSNAIRANLNWRMLISWFEQLKIAGLGLESPPSKHIRILLMRLSTVLQNLMRRKAERRTYFVAEPSVSICANLPERF